MGHYWSHCFGSLLVMLLWVVTGHSAVGRYWLRCCGSLLVTLLWVITGHVAVGRYWSRSCGSLLVTLLWITAAPCSCVDHVPVGHYRSRCFGSLLATFRCCGSLYWLGYSGSLLVNHVAVGHYWLITLLWVITDYVAVGRYTDSYVVVGGYWSRCSGSSVVRRCGSLTIPVWRWLSTKTGDSSWGSGNKERCQSDGFR